MFLHPRFPYGVPETPVSTAPATPLVLRVVHAGWVLGAGRVGTRVGYTGTPSQLLEERYPDQRSGPVASCREAEWWVWVARTPGAHPCGALSAHPWTSLAPPRECRLWANKARFELYFSKVSQNEQVSPEKCHEACHSPYFQNGPVKSPLQILRFPFWPAFSHKELIGLF